ncbi:hypothetical protein HZB00_03575 [Candidatus Woesearchaeota archaeon]|nr:hypothetical protein [Candidatus Woesearchaeota archaeon]
MLLFQVPFSFRDFIDFMVESGVYTYFLPFILVFAIFFAILEKTKVFGESQRGVNVIVSVVAGLLILVQPGIIDTINTFLPRVSLIMVVILMGLLVISMVAGKKYEGIKGWLFGLTIIGIVIAFFLALSPSQLIDPSDKEALLRIAIPIGMVLIAIAVAMGVGGGQQESGFKKTLKEIGDAFNK